MLTTVEKVYGLSLIWKEAEYNFAFWDKLNVLDWDEEYHKALEKVIEAQTLRDYYLELSKFVTLLKDGHSIVMLPKDVFPYFLQENVFPVELAFIESKHIVVNFKKNLEGKIEPFSQVVKINCINVDKFIHEEIFPYCWHEKYNSAYWLIQNWLGIHAYGKKMTLELLTPTGEASTVYVLWDKNEAAETEEWRIKPSLKSKVNLHSIYKSSSHTIQMTDDKIAIVMIPSFMNGELQQEYYRNLPLLKEAKGIMIDIRDNHGGSSDNADAVVQSFIEGSFVNSTYKHPIHNGAFKSWARWQDFGDKEYGEIVRDRGNDEWLEKTYKAYRHHLFEEGINRCHKADCPLTLNQPVVVLSSCYTASAAEDFLVSLDYAKRITIVGTDSYGSTGNPLNFNLPGGGSCNLCTRQCTYPDGREFINKGIQPHVYADISLSDWKNEYDSVFDKGIEVLRSLLQ